VNREASFVPEPATAPHLIATLVDHERQVVGHTVGEDERESAILDKMLIRRRLCSNLQIWPMSAGTPSAPAANREVNGSHPDG
jgi:hypothetical protein